MIILPRHVPRSVLNLGNVKFGLKQCKQKNSSVSRGHIVTIFSKNI